MAAGMRTVGVVFTDLVGSTALASSLGPAGAERLRQAHFAALRAALSATGGVEVKNLGDGLMVVYDGASAALDGAVAMQQAIATHNRTSEVELAIRVGVSFGEVDEEDGDFFGEPVVEAARLCAKADGGQILVTELVRAVGGRRTIHEMVPVGALELKGLPEPVEAVEVRWAPPQESADTGQVPPPSRLERTNGVFVGRDAERSVLVDALKAACDDGRVRVVLIGGEPGIGKSTLASMFAQGAHRDGSTVLYGRCDQDLGIPYQPWREALEDLLAHPVPSMAEAIGANQGLLGSLGIGSGVAAPGSSDAATARYLGFGAVASVLAAGGEPAGLVAIIDDLHWADPQSLHLLRHLATTKQQMQMVLVGTFRESDVAAGTPLAGLLAELRREPTVSRMSLGGLGDLDVLALMESGANRPLESAELGLRDALMAETDGNPFFVGELLRHLAETGAFYQDQTGRWEATAHLDVSTLPVSVREVISERVAHLGDEAVRVLSVAAVIGRDFDIGVLASASDTAEGALLNVLDKGCAARLIADVGPGRLSFTHALIEHALYTQMSASRRALTHRRVAEALETLHGDDPGRAAELAHHWAQATAPQDTAKALLFAQRAADHALSCLAPEDARRWYGEALALLAQQRSPDERLRCELRVGLGEAQRQSGDPAFGGTLLGAAHEAMRLGDSGLLVRAALAGSRGIATSVGGVDADRVEVLRSAIAVLGGVRSAERAALLAQLAAELTFVADDIERRAVADDALALARDLDDPATLVGVLNLRATTLAAPDRVVEHLAEAREASSFAEELHDPLLTWWAAYWHNCAAWLVADLPAIERTLAVLSQLGSRLDEGVVQWATVNLAVNVALIRGDLAEGERLADEAVAVAARTGQQFADETYGVQLATIRREQDRAAEVFDLDLIQRVLAERANMLPGFGLQLARLYCDLGQPANAHQLLDVYVTTDFADLPWDAMWLCWTTCAADSIAELEWTQAADALLARLRPFADQWAGAGLPSFGPVARAAARLAALIGHFDEAQHFFTKAEATCSALDAPVFLAHTHLDWGRALTSAPGQEERGRAHLNEAVDLAASKGFALVARKARRALADLDRR